MSDQVVLFDERGASWWPVLWGPGFALAGVLVEAVTPGPKHWAVWALVAAGLAVAAVVWVHGRRRVCSLRLTPDELVVGGEKLSVSSLAAVTDVGAPVGARVLGGVWTPPKGTGEVPVRLVDGRVVLAWARDPAGLTAALRPLVES